MGPAKVTFDFDLQLKKGSLIATILDKKNSYTFNWIPAQIDSIHQDKVTCNARYA